MKTRKKVVNLQAVRRNQFLGALLIALGLGALIVVVRYFILSTQVETSVYQISPSELIPGAR